MKKIHTLILFFLYTFSSYSYQYGFANYGNAEENDYSVATESIPPTKNANSGLLAWNSSGDSDGVIHVHVGTNGKVSQSKKISSANCLSPIVVTSYATTIDLTKVKSTTVTLTVFLSYGPELTITKCELIGDTTHFKLKESGILGKVLKPDRKNEFPLQIHCFADKEGNYTSAIRVTTKSGEYNDGEVILDARKSVLITDEIIRFDSTYVSGNAAVTKTLVLSSLLSEYSTLAQICKITCFPSQAISFEENLYGTEGFSLDSSLFLQKEIGYDDTSNVKVPIKFKPVKEGLHTATLQLYLNPDSVPTKVQLMGYGKALTNIDNYNEANNSVYVNTTLNEVVIQSDGMNIKGCFSIYNQLGEVVMSESVDGIYKYYTFSFNGLRAGMYYLISEVNSKKESTSFIIVK